MLFGSVCYKAQRHRMCNFEVYIISIYHLKNQNIRNAESWGLFLYLPIFLTGCPKPCPPRESFQHLLTFGKVRMKNDEAARGPTLITYSFVYGLKSHCKKQF